VKEIDAGLDFGEFVPQEAFLPVKFLQDLFPAAR